MNSNESSRCISFPSLDLTGIQRLADAMVRRLPHMQTIALVGTLGAGKTTLVQAIATAVGIDAAEVTSPTFTLLQTHVSERPDAVKLNHLDAYRLADEDEFLELGVEELFEEPNTWTLVEWADRVVDVMPPDTLWLRLDLTDQKDRRSVTMTCASEDVMRCLNEIADDDFSAEDFTAQSNAPK